MFYRWKQEQQSLLLILVRNSKGLRSTYPFGVQKEGSAISGQHALANDHQFFLKGEVNHE
jgi:hypothetical protein